MNQSQEEKGSWLELIRGRYGLYVLVINIGVFQWAINNLMVAGVMPTVVADIGGLRIYSWTTALFSMGSVIGAASASPLREMFGSRRAYIGAGIVYLIGQLGASMAPNMETLVAMRLIQGLGGGAISSHSYGLMASLFPERLRSRALAFTSTSWGVATALGPGYGGLFAEFGLWRPAFWGLAPLGILFILLAAKVVPAGEPRGTASRLPYGRLALVGSSVLALSATSQADTLVLRLALVFLSLALAVAMFRRDANADRPMFPRKALRLDSQLGTIYWLLALNSMAVVGYSTFQTLQLQMLHGAPPIVAAYLFMLSSFSWSVTTFFVASARGKWETVAIFLGLLTLLAGCLGQAMNVVDGSVLSIGLSISISGAGIGFMNNLLIARGIRVAPEGERQTAGSSVQAIRTMGVAFGAAAAGLIAVAAGLVADQVTKETVAEAMRWVYGADVGIAVLSLLIAVQMVVTGRRERVVAA